MYWGLLFGHRLVVAGACAGCRATALLCRCCRKFRDIGSRTSIAPSPGHRERFSPPVIIPGQTDETLRCSRTSCSEPPSWRVVWRNPKIHAQDRRKIWLSCSDHKDYFEGYLGQRGFPVHAEALEENPA